MVNYDIATTHDEWLKLRRQGLGGSDIGTLMGLNPYKSRYELWLEKTGRYIPPDLSDNIPIQVGNHLEELAAQLFAKETGLRVQKDNKTYYHKQHAFLLANIDRRIVGEKSFVECKTTALYNRYQWDGEEIPASYILQVQHYLNVLDYDKAYIAVIIGNGEFQYKVIERDDELIEMYTKEATRFWNENVVNDVEPEVDGSESTKEALNVVYGTLSDNEYPLSTEHATLVQSISELRSDMKTLKKVKEEQENKLKQVMGQLDTTVLLNEAYRVTWKPQYREDIDKERLKKELPDIYEQYKKISERRPLRIKEIG